MCKFSILLHFNDLSPTPFKLFLELNPNLHLSYVFQIFPTKLGKSLCFVLIFHLKPLRQDHTSFIFHIIWLFLTLILYALFIHYFPIIKLIQKMVMIFVVYPLQGKLKISILLSIQSFNFLLCYLLFFDNIELLS